MRLPHAHHAPAAVRSRPQLAPATLQTSVLLKIKTQIQKAAGEGDDLT